MSVRRDLQEGSEPGMQSRGWVRGAGKGDCGDKIILLLAKSFSSSLFFFLPRRCQTNGLTCGPSKVVL